MQGILVSCARWALKYAPELMAIFSAGGVFITSYKTGVATLKAEKKLKKLKEYYGDDISSKILAKELAPIYLEPIMWALLTSGMMIGSTVISKKRLKSMTGIAAASGVALTEYKNKVKDILGEDKAKEVEHEIAQAHADKVSKKVEEDDIPPEEEGKALFLDTMTNQLIWSTHNDIANTALRLNQSLHSIGDYVTVGEWLNEIGAKRTVYPWSKDLIWSFDNPIAISFTSITFKGHRAFSINYDGFLKPYYNQTVRLRA